MKLFINGRFLTQPVSGVQRYAREILTALDGQLTEHADVLVPRAVDHPDWRMLRPCIVRGGRGHLWEQVALARASRAGVLLSLGNTGPLTHPAQIVAFHDAHLYDMPEAFSRYYRLIHRVLRPRLAQRAAELVTVSTHSARQLAHHLAVPMSRFSIVPNAAEHVLTWPKTAATPQRYGLRPGDYLLTVGNRSPNKNIAALVEAHGLAGPDIPELVIIGGTTPGVAEDRIGRGARALGRVPDADLRGLYEGASGFVFPSLNEGFGIPPLEAMALGVPVLCAKAGAMPELFGQAPVWFDPRDIRDMSVTMRCFAQMPGSERREMRRRGLEVAEMYRWRGSAANLLGIVTRVRNRQGSMAGTSSQTAELIPVSRR